MLHARSLVFCILFCRSFFVLFVLTIVLSVLQFTASDYSLIIFQLSIKFSWRVSHVELEMLTIPEHLSSPTGFSGIRVACSIFSFFCILFCILLVIPFVSTIVLSALEFTASDYSFAIFTLFIIYSRRVPHMEQELPTVPEHPSSPTGFSGVRVACSIFRFFLHTIIVLFVQFVCFRCLSFSDLQILITLLDIVRHKREQRSTLNQNIITWNTP